MLTRLNGGYDATIGADPNTLIQIYCFEEKTAEDLCALLCLTELDLEYDLMELPNPIPDWFLRIHPDGTLPALRNPVDESLNNDIVSNTSDEADKVNQYLCKVYQATKENSTCPLLPLEEQNMATMEAIQSQIYETILPACKSFLDDEDSDQDPRHQAAAEAALRSLFLNPDGGFPYLVGQEMTLVDITLFTQLQGIFLELNTSKKCILSSQTMGCMKAWHEACASRPAFQAVLTKEEKE